MIEQWLEESTANAVEILRRLIRLAPEKNHEEQLRSMERRVREWRIRSTPEALLQLVRERWSIEGWHWIRDTQLHEDAHHYRGNGAGAMATLQTAALNLLRLTGFQSIRAGMLGGDARHHGAAGDGDETTGTKPGLIL